VRASDAGLLVGGADAVDVDGAGEPLSRPAARLSTTSCTDLTGWLSECDPSL
jgi:hypothetical protein